MLLVAPLLPLLVAAQVDLRQLPQADLLPPVQVMFLLDLLVLPHPEALVPLLLDLLVTPQAFHHPVCHLRVQAVLLRAPLHRAQVTHLAVVPASHQVTILPPALVRLHLEVSTLVVHHLTVLL
jgi:hypothetical protein